MKLFEMRGRLPTKAGLASLDFDRNTMPTRAGKSIGLPNHPEAEFFQMRDGAQFLVRLGRDTTSDGPQVWFGGTDEQPFLVRVREETFSAFQREGEQAFYDQLKPEVATKLEQAFHTPARRQGDIFAIPLPYTWKQIEDARFLCLGEKSEPEEFKALRLFETRHKLNGRLLRDARLFGSRYVIGEGVIEAPDHAPLKLEGTHVLVQAQNLWNPKEAD